MQKWEYKHEEYKGEVYEGNFIDFICEQGKNGWRFIWREKITIGNDRWSCVFGRPIEGE